MTRANLSTSDLVSLGAARLRELKQHEKDNAELRTALAAAQAEIARLEQANGNLYELAQAAARKHPKQANEFVARQKAEAALAALRAALRAILDDAVGSPHDALWIVRREFIEEAKRVEAVMGRED